MLSIREKIIKIFYKAATKNHNIRYKRFLITPLGGIFFFSFIATFIYLSTQLDKFLRFPKPFLSPINIILSIPFLIIGVIILSWSLLHFIKKQGTPVPLAPPPKLIISGPYKYVRNPLLSGLFILLFGVGTLLNSISIIFIFNPLFISVNILELKTIEEPELEKRFGKEYFEYKKKTPMFIPWFKKNKK